MAINYTAAFHHAEFWKKSVAPFLRHVSGPMSFSEYLTGFYKTQTPVKTFGIPLPYIYSLDFLKKFQDKCVTFQYNNPKEVSEGAAPISGIYQFTSSLHGVANLSIWHDEAKDKSSGHCTLFIIYEDFKDVLLFIDDNLNIVKLEEEESGIGFSTK
jgi:hypothetical protein